MAPMIPAGAGPAACITGIRGRRSARDARVIASLRMTMMGLNVEATEARAYTNDFRVYGLIHPRRGTAISRFLNQRDRQYLPMTRCLVYREGYEHPPAGDALLYQTDFAALPKSRLSWLVGGLPESPSDRGQREPRQVCVMYPAYVLTGTLMLPPRVRMTDHLTAVYSDKPFVELSDVSVCQPRPGVRIEQYEVVERHALATVNISLAGGLFDVTNPIGRNFRIEEN